MSEFGDVGGKRAGTEPYEPELGSLEAGPADRDEEVVSKTGTTTVGITTEDGVVVATDRRASLGGRFVSSKQVVKVEQVHPTAVLTLVGSVGGAQSFIRSLRSEANLYERRRGEPMPIDALATLASNFARGGPFRAIHPVLGGVDDEGSHVYTIDPAGGLMEDEYAVTGSGMQLAYGTIEGQYDAEMDLEAAEELAARAIAAASERDTGSGNGIVVATVTKEGLETDEYDDTAEILD
ncbi:MAG: archaeal proteasome endopeptidase complex subunit beta [Haloarculaceae archaeon]